MPFNIAAFGERAGARVLSGADRHSQDDIELSRQSSCQVIIPNPRPGHPCAYHIVADNQDMTLSVHPFYDNLPSCKGDACIAPTGGEP